MNARYKSAAEAIINSFNEYTEKEMIIGSNIFIDGYDCMCQDSRDGIIAWSLAKADGITYTHTITTRCHGYRSTLRAAIKEIEMKEGKKDVVQFEMGTNGNGVTSSALSQQGIQFAFGVWDEGKHLKPDTRYAVRMVAVPEGYRVATYEEAAKCDPLGCKFLDSTGSWASVAWPKGLCRDYKDATYIVPKETEEDRKKRKSLDRIEAAVKELAAAKEEIIKGE